jgi:hypothetical protein
MCFGGIPILKSPPYPKFSEFSIPPKVLTITRFIVGKIKLIILLTYFLAFIYKELPWFMPMMMR